MQSAPGGVITQQRPRRRIEGPIQDAIRLAAIDHPDWTPAQVHQEICAAFPRNGVDVVSLRTVQRVVADIRAASRDDEPWTIGDGDPEDLALVLPVVRWLMPRGGRLRRGQAAWIARIRRAFPDFEDPGQLHYLAVLANRNGNFLRDVERFLTFAPWRDGGAAYREAADHGWWTLEAKARQDHAEVVETMRAELRHQLADTRKERKR